MTGLLSVVATPIGNLSDASERMRTTLAAADLVLVEDTRRSGRLLQQFGLKKPLFALHDHNEGEVVARLLERLLAGEHLALISDAGTPAVSDPGFRLIRAAQDAGVTVSPVPGASAVIAALSAAGLPTDKFCFEGFLPAKTTARLTALRQLIDEPRTMVFYEAVHRIEDCIRDCIEILGSDRLACVARELTKMHEQIVSGSLAELHQQIATGVITSKGEFVLLVAGADNRERDENAGEDLLRALVAENVAVKTAAKVAAKLTGGSKNALYQLGLSIRGDG